MWIFRIMNIQISLNIINRRSTLSQAAPRPSPQFPHFIFLSTIRVSVFYFHQELGSFIAWNITIIYYKMKRFAMVAESCIQWLEAIAAAVPKTDLFYYHIPFTTNAGYTLYDVLVAARNRVPTLVGTSYVLVSPIDTNQILRAMNR